MVRDERKEVEVYAFMDIEKEKIGKDLIVVECCKNICKYFKIDFDKNMISKR
ncbi:MAG TPA: hypothetical protein IAB70_02025 [Candidatus Merdicola faecigallinarum]|mgnify:CR=1 FL=1|uniref:Uncharacterized protein n=1 Tax=Candidatus Merdicola faecigallinarum TaxID=2840862 RepID=A0A9D1M0M2_9FIRM|nr:hypothetical protein [Candidatus Merdicola faecigallinarum]